MNSRKAFECIGLQCLHVRHCTTILHGKWNALPFALIYPVCPVCGSKFGFWAFDSLGRAQWARACGSFQNQMSWTSLDKWTTNITLQRGTCLQSLVFALIFHSSCSYMFRKSLPNWVNYSKLSKLSKRTFLMLGFSKKGPQCFFLHPVIGQERLAPLAHPTSRLTPRTITGWWWLEPWNFEWLSILIGNFIVPTDEVHHFSEGLKHVETRNHQPDSNLSFRIHQTQAQGQPPQAEIAQTIETQVNSNRLRMFWTLFYLPDDHRLPCVFQGWHDTGMINRYK